MISNPDHLLQKDDHASATSYNGVIPMYLISVQLSNYYKMSNQMTYRPNQLPVHIWNNKILWKNKRIL